MNSDDLAALLGGFTSGYTTAKKTKLEERKANLDMALKVFETNLKQSQLDETVRSNRANEATNALTANANALRNQVLNAKDIASIQSLEQQGKDALGGLISATVDKLKGPDGKIDPSKLQGMSAQEQQIVGSMVTLQQAMAMQMIQPGTNQQTTTTATQNQPAQAIDLTALGNASDEDYNKQEANILNQLKQIREKRKGKK